MFNTTSQHKSLLSSAFLAAAFATAPAFAAAPQHLTVDEHFVNPIGLHGGNPVFSWKLPEDAGEGQKQSAYLIQTTSNNGSWTSGWISSDQSTFVPYAGEPLSSRQQVEW